MAEHDYVIDNQSAPSFRTDLNNALMAIVSQNSKSTAPTTTYANMIWYDTTNNQLKKRNEANSAWIVLGTIDEGAGTFTPSGERALATQAQAEAGTDNTTLMTPLRTAQAISTTDVLSKIAAATAGAVGTYIFATGPSGTNFGDVVSGASLKYASATSSIIVAASNPGSTPILQGFNVSVGASGVPSGSWRCVGYISISATATGTASASASATGATLWLRIS